MIRLLAALVLALLLPSIASIASAAERRPKPSPEPPAHARFSKNGEMERQEQTPQAWAAQADQITTTVGELPYFTGAMVWRGRADREYMPFHQWEIRLRAGEADLPALRLRVIPLGADFKPLLGRAGHWVELGDLGRGRETDFSYKLRIGAPVAYRVEVAWKGGEQSYLTGQLSDLPQIEGASDKLPRLLVLEPNFEYDGKRRKAAVMFYLRNEGGADAHEVVHTIRFLDADRKTVHSHKHVPNGGTVPAGYTEAQKLVVDGCPAFRSIHITTSKREDRVTSLDPGSFSAAAEIQVAELVLGGGKLQAKVRNGLGEAVRGLVITFQFVGKDQQQLGSVEVPVGDLAPGEIKPLVGELAELEGVTGWGVALAFGAGAPRTEAAPTAQPKLEPVRVEGLEIAVASIDSAEEGLRVGVVFANHREEALARLHCTVTFLDGAGGELGVEVPLGALAAGARYPVTLDLGGIQRVAGIRLAWRSGGAE